MLRSVIIAALLTTSALQGGGQPVNIPVTEVGWKFGTGTGPYGTNGCYSGYGTGSCSQDLGISPEQIQGSQPGQVKTGFYTITFTVLNRYAPYPAYYQVGLNFGTQELCSPDGWATRVNTQVTFVCPCDPYLVVDRQLPNGGPPQGSRDLVLSFSGSYWLVLFDNFSLTFTPTN